MEIRPFVVVLPMLIFLLAGCSAPPTAEADAARQSLASASGAGADKYAAASLKEAQTAQAALDAELGLAPADVGFGVLQIDVQ